MLEQPFVQLLILLAAAVAVVGVFQRLHVPSSLGYLLVGVFLGPYTPGPVIEGHQLRVLAEFGIVFLLFTIGLSFSLPQIHALRHQMLGLGTGQVVLTTAVVGLVAWLAGLPPAAAFVVGAVFAQSSTTIISKQLTEQGEDNSRHGRLGTALSVFQDVTAVPFVIVIPVLGMAVGVEALAASLGWAVAKAILAFALVFLAGRWLLRPLFHAAAASRSAELFTLTVLLSMIVAPFLIRYNHSIARRLVPRKGPSLHEELPRATDATAAGLGDHVIICGYGRIGQSVGHFLEEEKIRFVALDLDASRVREAHLAGEPVFYGDAADRGMLESVGIGTARLMVISHHDTAAALRVLQVARELRPGLPVMARTRDESQVDELRQAGAVEVVPETLEAAMMIAAHALLLLDVPLTRVVRRIQEQRANRYRLLREFIRGDGGFLDDAHVRARDRLHPVLLPIGSPAVGRALGDLALPGVVVTALVRNGERQLEPPSGMRLEAGDVVVLFGSAGDVERAEATILG
jgi:voltage-gated potassium channel Kch